MLITEQFSSKFILFFIFWVETSVVYTSMAFVVMYKSMAFALNYLTLYNYFIVLFLSCQSLVS